jgi:pimeloyl-ACP methyl ester carboxylesterase
MAHSGLDIFIGGGGDDLAWLSFGVVRAYAERYAAETGRPVIYSANARVLGLAWRVRRLRPAAPLNIVGHSWGALDAYRLAVLVERARFSVDNLITLDPVGWPFGRAPRGLPTAPWLNVDCAPSRPDASDRMTNRWPWSRKPSGLPVERAAAKVVLDLNHWNVEAMMQLGGARERLDASWRDD